MGSLFAFHARSPRVCPPVTRHTRVEHFPSETWFGRSSRATTGARSLPDRPNTRRHATGPRGTDYTAECSPLASMFMTSSVEGATHSRLAQCVSYFRRSGACGVISGRPRTPANSITLLHALLHGKSFHASGRRQRRGRPSRNRGPSANPEQSRVETPARAGRGPRRLRGSFRSWWKRVPQLL